MMHMIREQVTRRQFAAVAGGAAFLLAASLIAAAQMVTFPRISEEKIPIHEIKPGETAYATIRKPPGEGPFPAVIFLHGGLGQARMENLRQSAVNQPAQARFLAWGYVIVNATRRANHHDPQDRGLVTDTLAIFDQVKALPYVDEQSIALYGGSGGGTLALEVASVTDDLAAVVAGEPATIIYMGMFTMEHVDFGPNGRPAGDRRWDIMKARPQELYTPRIRAHTRKKLSGLSTPVLILHGDQHPLKHFNFELFIPEMEAMGKSVTLMKYPGALHGFYWGKGRIPALARKANEDAEAYLRQRLRTPPAPVDESWIERVAVKPLEKPDNNQHRSTGDP